ncbi:lycopene cyclase domain-containing protein [Paracrocinitomix mangrovi]|uniref:lycopene cyclase domain-containing protein n=1 Tax=Paracrocinitomix mangrovi TaxID=2862509 RepID=UPI001C8F0DE3|nr:lycopene cyclase domain-containing protein [Paracrocinitomix mangrovi]UKN03611.1 lycopene cyclase domain-containing protein [Paracrocinitomix mangrovi]
MTYLYLILMLGTLFFPLILSFDKKVAYFKSWKWSFLSSILIAIPYVLWDEYFTIEGIWGFNPKYLSGIYLGHLPLEEVLFFVVVPFACTFIYECVKYYVQVKGIRSFNRFFAVLFLIYSIFLYVQNMQGFYTFSSVGIGILVLFIFLRKNERFLFLPLSFLITLIPFLLVNGVLTGAMIEGEIVWYNPLEFSDLRIWTIPMEDVIYSWGLLASNMMLFQWFKDKSVSSKV